MTEGEIRWRLQCAGRPANAELLAALHQLPSMSVRRGPRPRRKKLPPRGAPKPNSLAPRWKNLDSDRPATVSGADHSASTYAVPSLSITAASGCGDSGRVTGGALGGGVCRPNFENTGPPPFLAS